MELLAEAMAFAIDAHGGTKRKGDGSPAILHAMEAAAVAATLTDDIHVDKSSLPPEMREVLEHFREHEFIPYDPKYHFQGTEAAPEDEGELEHG